MPTKEEQQQFLDGVLAEKAKQRALAGEAARKLADQERLADQLKQGPPPVPVPAAVPVPTPTPSATPSAAPVPTTKPDPVPAAPPGQTPTATVTPAPPTAPAPEPPVAPPGQGGLKQYEFVVDGATLKCDKGSAPGLLRVVAKRPEVGGRPGANTADNAPLANIPSFGGCKLQKNKPCVPAPTGWQGYFPTTRVGDAPALLLEACTNQCDVGGTIKITRSGQTGPTAPLDLIAAPPVTDASWTCGAMPEGAVQRANLVAMPGIKAGGPPVVNSNNPESIYRNGILFAHDGLPVTDGRLARDEKSGALVPPLVPNMKVGDMPLKEAMLVASHQNKTGSPSTIWVVARNPSATESVTVDLGGSGISSNGSDKRVFAGVPPVNGQPVTRIIPTPDRAKFVTDEQRKYTAYTGRSVYYNAALDALNGATPDEFDGVIPPGGTAVLYKEGPLAMGGGMEAILNLKTSGGQGVYTYVVATASGNPADALAAVRSRKMASGNELQQMSKKEGAAKDAFGTTAGVYAGSKLVGDVPVPLPKCDAFLTFSLTDSTYSRKADGPRVQSLPGLLDAKGQSLVFADSAQRTHSNYGLEYDLFLVLRNDQDTPRQVRAWLSHNAVYAPPGMAPPVEARKQLVFNGPVNFNGASPIPVLITWYKSSQQLTNAAIVVPAHQEVRVPLRFFSPGMSSGGLQLKLESKQ